MTQPLAKSKRVRIKIECERCKKKVIQVRPGGRFCSQKCRQIAWREKRTS